MRARRFTRLCVCLALFAATLGASGETIERRVRVGAVERSYEIDLPSRASRADALPAVIVFHGGGGSAQGTRKQTRMSAKGEAVGFIAVYPQGSGPFAARLLTWNAVTCCGRAMHQRVDEMAFVRALLDDLQAVANVDRARIYATGISNGGMMAYRVACELADRFAAIAVVAGEMTTLDDCRPARPMPVLVIHGTADRNLPYDGGVGAAALAPHQARSVAAAVEFWRRSDACAGEGQTVRSGAVTRLTFAPCADGSAVELVTIEGGGHSWPGGDRLARFLDPPSPALDATDEIWRFFARH